MNSKLKTHNSKRPIPCHSVVTLPKISGNLCNLWTIKIQNEPNFAFYKIALSSFFLMPSAYCLMPGAAKNEPKNEPNRTQFEFENRKWEIENDSGVFSILSFGVVWDKLGAFMAHIGACLAYFGVVWTHFGNRNSPKTASLSQKQ